MKAPSPGSEPDDSPAAALYRQHGPLIFAWLLKKIPAQEDAEDLLLEVFLAAFERNRLLAVPEEKRLAWLLSVAQHKLVDYYRLSSRRQQVPLDAVAATLEADEALAPEAVALRHERHANLRAALHGLSPIQQEVVRLRFGEGLRCAQIATVLGKREGAVRSLLWRALTLLRARYGGDQEGKDRDG
ncbi:MAG TPA: sigma-70 family RNA polymerase sigma factor [Ktedonobacterales bacterium]|jgi:RNA polymerase sigma-70 factor (ECF subfamily)